MKLPRVEFNIGHLTWDIDIIERFLKNKRKELIELRNRLLKIYPGLKKTKNREDIRKFLLKKYKENFNEIHKKIIYFQEKWEKINNKVLKAISDVIESRWGDKKVIIAYVSVNSICPRNLKNYTFSVYYKSNVKRFLHVCVHELVHFLYFKKLIEIYPKIDTKTFNEGKRWKLSEILAPILMNNPKIVKIIGKSDIRSYACSKEISEKFWNLYQESLRKKESFEIFYKKCEKIKI